MKYRRSVIAQDQSVALSSITTFDLPVNPLSFLMFTMRFLNVTDEATLAQVLARITNVTVTRFGATIFSMSGTDMHKVNAIMLGNAPILSNQVATDNAARYLSMVVPFSRALYSPLEGLPATQRGELKLQVEMSASETDVDNVSLQIEAVEMLGATPKQYLKITTLSLTPVSGVENDAVLPMGNKYAGIAIFSTTVPTGTAFTTSADKVRLLIDNVEDTVAASNWESIHGELIRKMGHRQDYDASADNDDFSLYGLLDFSPLNDDSYLVDTKGKSSAVLKITGGDTNAIRVFPIEIVAA